MKEPAYPAARVVAPKVREHLTRHPGAAHTTSIAATEVIEAVIDAAFWASLRREEGYVPKISLAIALVASQDGRFTVFAWSPCDELVRAHRVETLLL